MRYTLIDEREAPPRPTLRRGGKRRLEMNDLLEALTPGKVAKIEPAADGKQSGIRGLLFDAAASLGKRVEVWEDADGAVYAKLMAGEPGADSDE